MTYGRFALRGLRHSVGVHDLERDAGRGDGGQFRVVARSGPAPGAVYSRPIPLDHGPPRGAAVRQSVLEALHVDVEDRRHVERRMAGLKPRPTDE